MTPPDNSVYESTKKGPKLMTLHLQPSQNRTYRVLFPDKTEEHEGRAKTPRP